MDREELFQIGEAAERVGLSLRTLRHWEEVGLVLPTARSKGGFRLYSASDLEHALVVKSMKPLGLTLEEMGELLSLIEAAADVDTEDSALVASQLEAYARRTEERIKRLLRDMDDATTLLESIHASIRALQAVPQVVA